jgi:hypothetical protein
LDIFGKAFDLPLSETLSETLSSHSLTTGMLIDHKLKVYEKALALAAGADELSASWGRQHAIVDHYRRASESIVLILPKGRGWYPVAIKPRPWIMPLVPRWSALLAWI